MLLTFCGYTVVAVFNSKDVHYVFHAKKICTYKNYASKGCAIKIA